MAAAAVGGMGVGVLARAGYETFTIAAQASIKAGEEASMDIVPDNAATATTSNAKKVVALDATQLATETAMDTTEEESDNTTEAAQAETKSATKAAQANASLTENASFSDQFFATMRFGKSFGKSLGTTQGRTAFTESLQESTQTAAGAIAKSVKQIPDQVAATPQYLVDGAKSAAISGINTISDISDMASTQLAALAKLANKISSMSTQDIIENVGIAIKEGISNASKTVVRSGKNLAKGVVNTPTRLSESSKSVFSNLSSDPQKAFQIAIQLIITAFGATDSVYSYDSTKLQAKAITTEASVLESKAFTTQIQQQITIVQSNINNILSDMQQSISTASNTLSQYGQLTAETLGQQSHAA
jgi:hypothetical protein